MDREARGAVGENNGVPWWTRWLVHITGDPKRVGAERDRRWMLLLICLMVIGSLALVLVLVVQDLSGTVADRPLSPRPTRSIVRLRASPR